VETSKAGAVVVRFPTVGRAASKELVWQRIIQVTTEKSALSRIHVVDEMKPKMASRHRK